MSIPLELAEVASAEELLTKTANAKSLVLTYDEKTHVATSNAMMRLIASMAPATGLLGDTDAESALVDGWISFVFNSLDVPLEVLNRDATVQAVQTDVAQSLDTLDAHLAKQTYMVGDKITLADISLVLSLYRAVALGVWNVSDKKNVKETNLARWYDTVIHQSFFQELLKTPASSGTIVGGSAHATVSSGPGLMMNGIAPSVVGNAYTRRRIRIKEVIANGGADFIDQTITVAGWARTTRNANKGQLLFVELNDGSCGACLQCVLDSETTAGFEESKASGGTGASFQLVGKVIKSPAAGQAVEMQVTTGKLLGAVYGGKDETVGGMFYPLSKKAHTLEHMREHAHLRARGRVHASAMRIRHAMAYATHNFFHNHGFLYIHTPILTGADCEGAGEQFGVTTMLGSDHLAPGITLPIHHPPAPEEEEEEEGKTLSKKEQKRLAKKTEAAAKKPESNKPVEEKIIGAVDYSQDFFGHRVNLTVSGQLNVETHACALSDVYTFGPTFRAEKRWVLLSSSVLLVCVSVVLIFSVFFRFDSFTSRHLSEFWMIEPEIAFANLTDDINLAEDYLKYCVRYALECCADDLEFFENSPHGEEGLRDRLRNVLENPFKVSRQSRRSSFMHRNEERYSMGISLNNSVEIAISVFYALSERMLLFESMGLCHLLGLRHLSHSHLCRSFLFQRLTYTEAIEVLQKAVDNGVEFEEKPDWGIDLPSEHERYLCEQVYKQPVVLTDYPKEIKAFYMKLNEDKKTVAAADILVPKIGEIIGGSEREYRLDVLMERCLEMNLDPKHVWWYLDLRRFGTVPHAGFGLGFERLILFITGLDNIRDVIPFPRWAGNADF